MTKKILVPLDNSEISKELVKIADEWAQRSSAELFFLHVGTKEGKDGIEENRRFSDFLNAMDIKAGYRFQFRTGTFYHEILEQEQEIQPDLIIMGAHRHTMLGRMFLGSNTKYVIHHCACPVYVYKQQKLFFENKIIVPIDYSEVNKPVVQLADEWGQRTHSELYFIGVDPYPESSVKSYFPDVGIADTNSSAYQMEQEKIQTQIQHQESALQRFVSSCEIKSKYHCMHKFGEPYIKILELQKYIDAGLIVMAAHSHTMLSRLFIGSNTDYLLHHASCPMYVYKEGK
ncbi:MAG: universal stress protein [SAR324 cluster bacterium]|nr:universal stress protein [SAR324 cluster bacterium]